MFVPCMRCLGYQAWGPRVAGYQIGIARLAAPFSFEGFSGLLGLASLGGLHP